MTRGKLLRRLFDAALTIAFIALVNFMLFRLIPGDPVRSMVPRNVTAEQRDALRAKSPFHPLSSNDAGIIRPVVDSVFDFEQTREALAYVEHGRAKAGKVVVRMK